MTTNIVEYATPAYVERIRAELARARHVAGELMEALREAEAGLEFAGADIDIPEGDFVPSPTVSLRAVRAAIAKAEAR